MYLEDITGTLQDLIGDVIQVAEERCQNYPRDDEESGTWTFYELRTVKAFVTMRWGGYSNGYYSERVDFEEIT